MSWTGPPSPTCQTNQPPNGPSDLEVVAGPELLGEVGRDLPVGQPVHDELDVRGLGRRGDGVAALSGVPVGRGEAYVQMLAGSMSGPGGRVEHDPASSRRLRLDLQDRCAAPAQSPA